MKINNKLLGDAGEFLVHRKMTSEGFDIVKFGKEMRSKKSVFFKENIPTIPDYSMGYSYGTFDFIEQASRTKNMNWLDSEIPRWADFEYKHLKETAYFCKKNSTCKIRDRNRKNAPCYNLDSILDKKWLLSIEPYNELPTVINDDTNKEVILKGHSVISECINNFIRITIEKHRNHLPYNQSFLIVNLIVTKYIDTAWHEFLKNNPLPYNIDDFKYAERVHGKHKSDELKDINREHLKKFPSGHPGRYDFIARDKDGKIYAVEVKVNSSKLSYWQVIRLSLLKRFGCDVIIANVSITKDDVFNLIANNFHPENVKIDFSNHLNTSLIDIPSDEEILKTLNFGER